MKLMVINGSVRKGRMADKIVGWVSEILSKDSELELDIVDLAEVDLPFFDEEKLPTNQHEYTNPNGAAWAKRVGEANAFIFVTPEYNHGPTAVQKNAVDWVNHEWRMKPAGFVSYGGAAAGTRAVQQLKLVLLNVGVVPSQHNVHIPLWGGGVDENGRPKAHFDESLIKVADSLKEWQKRLSD